MGNSFAIGGNLFRSAVSQGSAFAETVDPLLTDTGVGGEGAFDDSIIAGENLGSQQGGSPTVGEGLRPLPDFADANIWAGTEPRPYDRLFSSAKDAISRLIGSFAPYIPAINAVSQFAPALPALLAGAATFILPRVMADMADVSDPAQAKLRSRIEELRNRRNLPDWIAKALDGMASFDPLEWKGYEISLAAGIDVLERAAQYRPSQILKVAGLFFKDSSWIPDILNASSEKGLKTDQAEDSDYELRLVPFYFGAALLDNPAWQIRFLAAEILKRNTRVYKFPAGLRYGADVVKRLIEIARTDPSWLVRASAAKAALFHSRDFGIGEPLLAQQIEPHKMMADLLRSGDFTKASAAFDLMGEASQVLSPARIRYVTKAAFSAAATFTDDSSKRDYLVHIGRYWDESDPRLRKMIASDRLTQHFIIDDIRKDGSHGYDLIAKFAPFVAPERFRLMRDELTRVVMAEPAGSIDVDRFQTLLNPGLDGVSDDKRLALFKKIFDAALCEHVGALEYDWVGRLFPSVPDILKGASHETKEAAVQHVLQNAGNLMRSLGWASGYRALYLLFYLAKEVDEFRIGRILGIFVDTVSKDTKASRVRGSRPRDTLTLGGSEGSTNDDFLLNPRVVINDLSRLNIPQAYYSILIESIFMNMFVWNMERDDPKARLVAQLLNDIDSEGTLQQVVNFLRRFNGLPQKLRMEFAKEVAAETERSLGGLPPAQRETQKDRLLINPNKAVQRLRQFLIRHLVQGLSIEDGERRMVAASIQQNATVWEKNGLLANLSSLLAFSDDAGRDAITKLTRQLTSAPVVEPTRQSGSVRFVNTGRATTLTEAGFPAEFVERWINGDKDTVIPLGVIESRSILKNDPLALKRSRYEFTLQQLAGHLNLTGASHMSSAEIASALKELFGSKTLPVTGYVDWSTKMRSVLDKMGRLADISETELEGMADFINNNTEAFKSGFGSAEIFYDLQELKRNINASALEGQAWLVISSDPAGFLNLGREPLVTCQDPTRNTGHTNSGQPVNRIGDGRFRYAAVYMGDVSVESGLAIPEKGAKMVARAQLEATLDGDAPKLLAERLYAAGGFVYHKMVAGKLRGFAEDPLKLDGDKDVFIQFDELGEYPPPLPDSFPIYRDTFRRP